METVGGAIERDAEARELKFYIPDSVGSSEPSRSADGGSAVGGRATGSGGGSTSSSTSSSSSGGGSQLQYPQSDISTDGLQRVFVHPSSMNFHNITYRPSSFVLYGELQAAATHVKALDSAKIYLRDTAEVSVYSLLLLGGVLEAQYSAGTVSVDGWIR